jgi:hypothetical protein
MRAAIRADEFDIRDEGSSGGYAPIAKVRGDKRHTMEQAASNARLIAASPELLRLLTTAFEESNKAMTTLGIPLISAQWHEETRATIEKATGETT